jgi:hypothetical protein
MIVQAWQVRFVPEPLRQFMEILFYPSFMTFVTQRDFASTQVSFARGCKPDTAEVFLLMTIKSTALNAIVYSLASALIGGPSCLKRFGPDVRGVISRRAVAEATRLGLRSFAERSLWPASPALRMPTKAA